MYYTVTIYAASCDLVTSLVSIPKDSLTSIITAAINLLREDEITIEIRKEGNSEHLHG